MKTKRTVATVLVTLGFLAGACPRSWAESYTTNIINGVSTNAGGPYYVGDTGPFNTLIITNAGRLTNTFGYIGNAAAASNNSAFVTGANSIWFNSNGFRVGNNGANNSLAITDGGTVRSGGDGSAAFIGGFSTDSTNNSVLVTGAGSLWSNSSAIYVGEMGGHNTLTIASSGKVMSTSSTMMGDSFSGHSNLLQVIGAGSMLTNAGGLWVGNNGAANRAEIADGAKVYSASSSTIGNGAGARSNLVVVAGSNSLWQASAITVGSGGAYNQLAISNGAQVISQDAIVGSGASGRTNLALISGAGSQWTNANALLIGQSGSANQMAITNGGQVHLGQFGTLGVFSSATNNEVLVSGTGSLWRMSQYLKVGDAGGGNRLQINNGGTVIASNVFIGSQSTSSNNTLTLAGGSLQVVSTNGTRGEVGLYRGALYLSSGTLIAGRLVATNGANSLITFSGGTLDVGSVVISNGLPFNVGNGLDSATFKLDGGTNNLINGLNIFSNATLTGVGTIVGTVSNAGSISPGTSPGILTINGDLTLLDGSLSLMELAGTNNAQYDQINVSGILRIGGLLQVTLTNSFSPAAGDLFDLFDFGSTTGVFSQTNLPLLGGGLVWNTDNLYTSGELSVEAIPEPSTALLLALGGAFACHGRRRMNHPRSPALTDPS